MTVDQVGCFRVHVAAMELQTQLDSSLQDSLTLLHVLLELQRRSPVKFTVAAATVNPETPEFAPEPLIDTWCKSLHGRCELRFNWHCRSLMFDAFCSMTDFAISMSCPKPTSGQGRNSPFSHVIKLHFMVHGQSYTLLGSARYA